MGFAIWKLFIFCRTALCLCNEMFYRQSSQGELLWYFHTFTVLTWDKVRAFEAANTKNQCS